MQALELGPSARPRRCCPRPATGASGESEKQRNDVYAVRRNLRIFRRELITKGRSIKTARHTLYRARGDPPAGRPFGRSIRSAAVSLI